MVNSRNKLIINSDFFNDHRVLNIENKDIGILIKIMLITSKDTGVIGCKQFSLESLIGCDSDSADALCRVGCIKRINNSTELMLDSYFLRYIEIQDKE